jgi:hypothetical protein
MTTNHGTFGFRALHHLRGEKEIGGVAPAPPDKGQRPLAIPEKNVL